MRECGPIPTRFATFDELLGSPAGVPAARADYDRDRATDRLNAWCRVSAGGDWSLFNLRLGRDGWSPDAVRSRLAVANTVLPPPSWWPDACWIQEVIVQGRDSRSPSDPYPFSDLFHALVDEVELRAWAGLDGRHLTEEARNCLRTFLLDDLTRLYAPSLYEMFVESGSGYREFVTGPGRHGLAALLDTKPVLLRLTATLVRCWLERVREFVDRLDTDFETVRRDVIGVPGYSPVVWIESGLSDRHRGGRTVQRLDFADGTRVLYKPKDMRIDAAWRAMLDTLNEEGPISLRAPRVLARRDYGWAEFITHTGCTDEAGCRRFYRCAGAWLALLHCFAATDMHHENLIAAGEQPVPVDLEMVLQPSAPASPRSAEYSADDAARTLIADSVVVVGLLPGYAPSPDRRSLAVGGFASGWTRADRLRWHDVNSDTMRPERVAVTPVTTNLPHLAGHYVGLGEYRDEFLCGFRDYAMFLASREWGATLERFAGVPIRKVFRPTEFYQLMLSRLRDDRTMADGFDWSVNADFIARLADWSVDDPTWPLQRAERNALIGLDVPLFSMAADGCVATDGFSTTATLPVVPGLERVRARLHTLDHDEINWQAEVIRQTSTFVDTDGADRGLRTDGATLTVDELAAEADAVAAELSRLAIRRGPAAAWIGLSWFTDSDASQLTVLGHDLYNGQCGIALFLSAHARVRESGASAELALSGLESLRAELLGRNAAHLARVLGLGGATGLGSIVYTFAVMARLLDDQGLLKDAYRAAELISDTLIAADTRFDAVAGSAGATLGLLRLHRDTGSDAVLDRAVACADHLVEHEPSESTLNGMSHGAAGFALALAAAGGPAEGRGYLEAARRWLDIERAGFDEERGDWRDLRLTEPHWRSQWCHGAVGIGLSRLAMARHGMIDEAMRMDVRCALAGADRGWPGHVDTLCCGSLGNIEFLRDAGRNDDARQRLSLVVGSARQAGGYRWNGGDTRFNIGLFRGLSGVGYTCLRAIDDTLPNVLTWE